MKRRADGKRSLLAARMYVNHHASQGKNACLDEMRNAIGNAAVGFAGKRPVHVDAIERRDARVGVTGALAQLGNQDHAAGHRAGVEVGAQSLHRDLALVFIAVRSAETDHVFSARPAKPVDHGQRQEGISPGPVQVERHLIVMLAGLGEID